MPSPSVCAVKYCRYENTDKKRSYFVVPNNREIAQKWWDFVKFHCVSKHYDFATKYSICDRHFEPSMLKLDTKQRRRLLPNAIPTILSPQPLEIMRKNQGKVAKGQVIKFQKNYKTKLANCRFCGELSIAIELEKYMIEMFNEITNLKLKRYQNVSNLICVSCARSIVEFYNFRKKLIESESKYSNAIEEIPFEASSDEEEVEDPLKNEIDTIKEEINEDPNLLCLVNEIKEEPLDRGLKITEIHSKGQIKRVGNPVEVPPAKKPKPDVGPKIIISPSSQQFLLNAKPLPYRPIPGRNAEFIIKEVKPVQSVTKPVQSVNKPVQSVTKPVQSGAKPVQSVTKPVQNVTKPVHSVIKPVQNEISSPVTCTSPAQITVPSTKERISVISRMNQILASKSQNTQPKTSKSPQIQSKLFKPVLKTSVAKKMFCSQCRQILDNEKYEEHLKEFHSKEKSFVCEICGSKTKSHVCVIDKKFQEDLLSRAELEEPDYDDLLEEI